MIRYTLKCEHGHCFDGWFASAAAFDRQCEQGLVTCSVCGSNQVEKTLMAPAVQPARDRAASPAPVPAAPAPAAPAPGPLSTARDQTEQAIRELRKEVEKNSDYVGTEFVNEARAMQLGEKPERSIYGEAPLEEARELIDEGVPVIPLPFMTSRKTN